MAAARTAWPVDAATEENQRDDPQFWRDKYLRCKQENEELKRRCIDYEDKLKKMATKYLRLVEDTKRRRELEGAGGGARPANRETEDLVEALRSQLHDRDKQIDALKNKLSYFRHVQDMLQSRRRAYDHVKSRVDTGATQKKLYPLLYQGPRALQSSPRRHGHDLPPPPEGIFDDEEAEKLREMVAELSDKLADEHRTVVDLRSRLDDERSRAEGRRERTVMVPDEGLVEELRQKKTQLAALQARMEALEAKFQQMKRNHSELLEQTERLNREYKEEMRLRVRLQHDEERYESASEQIRELNVIIDDLRSEKATLEEEHAKILSTALSGGEDKEMEMERLLADLREELKRAEAARRVAHEQAQEALEKAAATTAEMGALQDARRELEVKYYELKQENELLSEKLRYFTAESGIDFKELEEALALIRRRREGGEEGELNLLELDTQLRECRAHAVELAQDLEKTQKMLQLQERLGREYQTAIEEKERLLKELNMQLEEKRQDVARVIDRREARIKELEAQMRALLYRSKAAGVRGVAGALPDVELGEGENVVELSVVDADLNAELLALQDDSPVFAVVNFYVHPAQATPLANGAKPKFDFTMLFVVGVDNTFVGYLHERAVRIELCRARGLDFHTAATGEFRLTDLVAGDTEGASWTVDVFAQDGGRRVNAGTVRVSARMRNTIASSVQAYQESSVLQTALQPFDHKARKPAIRGAVGNPMEFSIHIGEVSGLPTLRLENGPSSSSVYCAFQFYFFGLYCTPHAGRSEEDGVATINDTQVFPIQGSAEFEQYRKETPLEILVLEDAPLAEGGTVAGKGLYGRVVLSLDRLRLDTKFDEELPVVDVEGRTRGALRVRALLEDKGEPSDDEKKKKRVQIEEPREVMSDPANFVILTIGQLKLLGPALVDPVVETSDLVVSYDFLGGPDDPLCETQAVQKQPGLDTVVFDYRRVFPIDAARHDRARWKLARMFKAAQPIIFDVEAVQGDRGVSLGLAGLSLAQVLEKGDSPDGMMLEVRDTDKTVVGQLQVVTRMVEALTAVV